MSITTRIQEARNLLAAREWTPSDRTSVPPWAAVAAEFAARRPLVGSREPVGRDAGNHELDQGRI